jgi:hypothetical protein
MHKTNKYKYPTPTSCKLQDRAVLCTADRVIALYNQETNGDAKKISKKVKIWFATQAKANGWAGAHFLPEVQSGHGAGCILFVPPTVLNVKVTVKQTTLVLQAYEGDE